MRRGEERGQTEEEVLLSDLQSTLNTRKEIKIRHRPKSLTLGDELAGPKMIRGNILRAPLSPASSALTGCIAPEHPSVKSSVGNIGARVRNKQQDISSLLHPS